MRKFFFLVLCLKQLTAQEPDFQSPLNEMPSEIIAKIHTHLDEASCIKLAATCTYQQDCWTENRPHVFKLHYPFISYAGSLHLSVVHPYLQAINALRNQIHVTIKDAQKDPKGTDSLFTPTLNFVGNIFYSIFGAILPAHPEPEAVAILKKTRELAAKSQDFSFSYLETNLGYLKTFKELISQLPEFSSQLPQLKNQDQSQGVLLQLVASYKSQNTPNQLNNIHEFLDKASWGQDKGKAEPILTYMKGRKRDLFLAYHLYYLLSDRSASQNLSVEERFEAIDFWGRHGNMYCQLAIYALIDLPIISTLSQFAQQRLEEDALQGKTPALFIRNSFYYKDAFATQSLAPNKFIELALSGSLEGQQQLCDMLCA